MRTGSAPWCGLQARTGFVTPPLGLVRSCIESDIQWDENGILMGRIVQFDGTNTPLNGFYAARYTPTNGICSFDSCIDTNDLRTLLGHYTYDCSAASYCGENAKRSCTGAYESQPCPIGATPTLPAIPPLAQVTCERELQLYTDDDSICTRESTSCEAVSNIPFLPPNGVYWTWSCRPRCLGCTPSGDCYQLETKYYSGEGGQTVRSCFIDQAGSEASCFQRNFGVIKRSVTAGSAILDTFGSYSCGAWLNGQQCSCTTCSAPSNPLKVGDSFELGVDCSSVASGTSFGKCGNGQESWTGQVAFVNDLDDSRDCPATGGSSVNGGAGEGGMPTQTGPTSTSGNGPPSGPTTPALPLNPSGQVPVNLPTVATSGGWRLRGDGWGFLGVVVLGIGSLVAVYL